MAPGNEIDPPGSIPDSGSRPVRCLACGSDAGEVWAEATDVEYFTTEAKFTYHRCRSCDCLWIDPVPTGALDTIYPGNYYSYVSKATSPVDTFKSALDKRLFRGILQQVAGDKLRVLDVGGGSGASLDLVRAADARISETVIVDLDAGARAKAESEGHTFFHGRIEDYDQRGSFEVILMLNLIEHVQNPADVLCKARDLLAPGGRLVIKTPNWRSYDQFLFRNQSWGGFHCPRHWVLWTLPGFNAFARSCGFEVASEKYTQGAPFWAVSVLNVLRLKGWVTVSRERPVYRHPLFGVLCGIFALIDLLRSPFAAPSQMFIVLK